MWNALSFLQKNLTYSIPMFMILGVICGYFYDMSFLRSTVMPLTFLLVYPMMVNLQVEKVLNFEYQKAQITTQIINFGIIPFMAYGLGLVFFPNSPSAMLGILLVSLFPTSGMTISYTGFAKGNVPLAVKMTVIGLILGSFATPFYASFLLGSSIEIPTKQIFSTIGIVILLPMIFGILTRKSLVKIYGKETYTKRFKKKFPMFSTLGVLGVVFVAMALKSKLIIENPMIVLHLLVPVVILYIANFLLSTIIAKIFFKRDDAIAVVFGSALRNLSVALAIAMSAFSDHSAQIAIIIAIAFILQAQAAAWYAKYCDKIFKNKTNLSEVYHEQI